MTQYEILSLQLLACILESVASIQGGTLSQVEVSLLDNVSNAIAQARKELRIAQG